MKVLSCSSIQQVRQSHCPQQSSEKDIVYHQQDNCLENVKQVSIDVSLNGASLVVEGSQTERQGEILETLDDLDELSTNSGGQHNSDKVNKQNCCSEPCLPFEDSHIIVDTIESVSPNGNVDKDMPLSDTTWLQGNESVAVRVKWRGNWEAGIRCVRADWPLSSLKAKPTHDRKQYLLIFFPATRTYAWADMQLVCPINEFPKSIACETRKIGLEMVKDLTIARKFIMQNLVLGILNVVDRFHEQAFLESACDVMFWKEFAMDASNCNGYCDLGRLLVKLQKMILQRFINAGWMQHCLPTWNERCQTALSAESIEILMKELLDSIMWSEVHSHKGETIQPSLVSEWKTWKHEVTKQFSISRPSPCTKELPQQNPDKFFSVNLEGSRKRPKLEVRRADAHTSQVVAKASDHAISLETDPVFSTNHETLKKESVKPGDASELPSSVANKWNDIVIQAKNSAPIPTNNIGLTPLSQVVATKYVETGGKNRQCIAYIESKGRQCVRWANEGEIYCCVHLASLSVYSAARVERPNTVDTPFCEGTTVLGTRCKHRALHGSSFCKKHKSPTELNESSDQSHTTLKRKLEEYSTGLEGSSCKDQVVPGKYNFGLKGTIYKDLVMTGEPQGALQLVLPSVRDENSSVGTDSNVAEVVQCVGSAPFDNSNPCMETPKRYLLYCEKHVPSWLKRARNGKSRIISKDVFTHLLKDCNSQERKVSLHRACELFYKLFKSILSSRNLVPKDVQFQWALLEASKDIRVDDFFRKLVHSERERIRVIWGFGDAKDVGVSLPQEEHPLPSALDDSLNCENDNENYKKDIIYCKLCSEEFLDDQGLGAHWKQNHKKEAQWLFRGYACAICLDSFTNKKLLESHVQERHHVQFVEHCMLMQCILCRSNFGNKEQLLSHVLSNHPTDLRLSEAPPQQSFANGEDSSVIPEQGNSTSMENNSENPGGSRRYICKFCGLKFDLLPDLGRHHQAAHMRPNLIGSRPSVAKRGVRYFAYRLKSGRLSHPKFKNSLAAVSSRIRNRAGASLRQRIQACKPLSTEGVTIQPQPMEIDVGRLAEFSCSSVADILRPELQKTKPRPNNHDILSIAQSVCCKVYLKSLLEERYGVLPESLYLRAAKLCSEQNLQVNWHLEGFACPKGCEPLKEKVVVPSLSSLPNGNGSDRKKCEGLSSPVSNEWETDESHCVISSDHLRPGYSQKGIVLCDDISFGQESVPVICVIDDELLDSVDIQDDESKFSMPWESFTYVTKPMLVQSCDLEAESFQLGCSCSSSTCRAETCDHVYLFNCDFDDAKDIFGKSMHGRFPYDENYRIILEEGYLVYECNNKCGCSRACSNRVLQNGVQVKLEVFRTEKKGWGVKAGEPILRGTFVCEYIGEIIDEHEATDRRNRNGAEGCKYFYDVDAHNNDMSRCVEGQARYVINATMYGNVSRFINYSCSPNLVTYQVLVESMDSPRTHIGLYANRDIAMGEELTYDYRYNLIAGEACPCYCGSSKCRGRLY